jgi:3-dehydroquinate synthetase
VAACVKWKARAVAQDERDASGEREALNFGHTVGHALETLTHYGYFRHGEAILIGMRAAAALSVIRGHLKVSAFDEINGFLSRFDVPKIPAGVTGRKLLRLIRYDKKARDGRVRFVLLKKIGQVVLDNEVRDAEFLQSLETLGIKP